MGRKRDPKPRRLTVVRYELPDGTRCKKGDPGAVRRVTKTDSYYLELPPKEAGGKKERIPLGTADEAVAWRKVRQVLDDRYKEELGILDDKAKHAARPIAEHLCEWLDAVEASGAGAKRVAMLRSRVGWLIEAAKWRRITDVSKPTLLKALKQLRDEGAAGASTRTGRRGRGSAGRGRGVSHQTSNHYLAHARQFASWLADERRLPGDPLAGLKGLPVSTDRRHDRRVPEDLEVCVLFGHLQSLEPPAPVRCRMTGPQRALGYQVAMCAGLRAGELRRLTPASFDLDSGDLRVTARSDKAKRKRLQALPRWLCDKLRVWLDGGGGLWADFPPHNPGRLLAADLALARTLWILEAGGGRAEAERRQASGVCLYETPSEDGPLYLDFHALRHWYVTQAAAVDGIAPSTLLEMARHTDPRLTLEVYAKAKREGVRHAVEQLPRPGGA